ncbi:MAG: TspO/MBR family protein [Clostridium sp.]
MKNILKVEGKFSFIPFVVAILISLGGGALIGLLIKNNIYLYEGLIKPNFAPPSWVFSIVWPILYILMGIASYRIYMIRDNGKNVGASLFFYLVQLLLNFLWPILFFSFRLYGLSFILLIVMFIFILITIVEFLKIDKIAGILLMPYLFWVVLAGVLNYFVWLYNEM